MRFLALLALASELFFQKSRTSIYKTRLLQYGYMQHNYNKDDVKDAKLWWNPISISLLLLLSLSLVSRLFLSIVKHRLK